MIDTSQIWTVIALLAVGSFALRFVFIGLIGNRPLPAWILRHLRYTAVAVLPALVAPLVMWPAATGGAPDAPRMLAALAALCVGAATRSVFLAICSGLAALYLGLWLAG